MRQNDTWEVDPVVFLAQHQCWTCSGDKYKWYLSMLTTDGRILGRQVNRNRCQADQHEDGKSLGRNWSRTMTELLSLLWQGALKTQLWKNVSFPPRWSWILHLEVELVWQRWSGGLRMANRRICPQNTCRGTKASSSERCHDDMPIPYPWYSFGYCQWWFDRCLRFTTEVKVLIW